jgi:hypothetical protein
MAPQRRLHCSAFSVGTSRRREERDKDSASRIRMPRCWFSCSAAVAARPVDDRGATLNPSHASGLPAVEPRLTAGPRHPSADRRPRRCRPCGGCRRDKPRRGSPVRRHRRAMSGGRARREGGALQRLVHAAVLAAVARSAAKRRGERLRRFTGACAPASVRAGTRERQGLAHLDERFQFVPFRALRRPSLFRSIRSWSRRSVRGGSRSSLTNSTQSAGADTTVMCTCLRQTARGTACRTHVITTEPARQRSRAERACGNGGS